MLGFIIGTVCLVGLVKVLRGHPLWGGHCGYAGWGGPRGDGFGAGGFHRRGTRWALRSVFERLGTMPGQERAIIEALRRAAESRAALRTEIESTRGEVARAVEGGLVDDATLEETFARHDRLLAQLRVTWVEALKTVTETLDASQRKELARLLASGPWLRGGPPPWAADRAWA